MCVEKMEMKLYLKFSSINYFYSINSKFEYTILIKF